ncbi:MAG: helix-turn-helix domain-containing protein [Candidatus Omnitrophica bacterium]|nr:helix-turn-helix domain-containing protein [Candidatus Omnitrophota bacterium]
MTVKIIIEPLQSQPLYQRFIEKANELKALGMSQREIAQAIGISRRTVRNACKSRQ